MTKQYGIEADVHMQLTKGYRVKAHISSIGVYINGIVVFPPDAKSDKWEFRSPAQKSGMKWSSTIEFDKSFPIWKEITEECFRAVKAYAEHHSGIHPGKHSGNTQDVVLDDIYDSPIDWDSVPF